MALNTFPLPFQTELMQLSPNFLASPGGGFPKRHLRPQRHSLSMSNSKSKPLDTCCLFPAGCACFLHTLTKNVPRCDIYEPHQLGAVTQTVLPVMWESNEWGPFRPRRRTALPLACSLIYYIPKYKTAWPAASLISNPGTCQKRPRHPEP